MNKKHSGISLPTYQPPSYAYESVVLHNGVAYVSGHVPKTPTEVLYVGKVGAEIDMEQAMGAAELALLNALSSLAHTLGGLDKVKRVLKIVVYVASAPGFNEQPKIADVASSLLQDMLGERGRSARSAIGVAELPRGCCVEIEMVVATA